MSDRTSTLTAVLVDSVSGPAKGIQREIANIGLVVSKVGSVMAGFGIGIGLAVFETLTRAISSLASVIPNLIESGNAYLGTLKDIQIATGMTAEQTSLLTGTLRNLGVPIDAVQQLMAHLGGQLARNEGLFAQLGIATRNSNGDLLSTYTVFQNARRAVAAHGESLLSTAAAQELFGRGGTKLLEALQATDAEWNAATESVRRWGGVVSQEAIDGADRFGDTLAELAQGITDVGTNIAAAVDPYLRAFVDSFATFIQSHLNEIVQFAVTVVSVVTGFISGLFGITDALTVSSDKAAAAGAKQTAWVDPFAAGLKKIKDDSDAFTTSLKAQIKAIDDHTHALQVAAERRRAIRERARLQEGLAAAQAQLADLRGNAPFLGGLTAAEQALAVQKHAQDIIDAEKDVQDQRKAIGDFEADQKDRAEAELLRRQKDRLQDLLAAQKATDEEALKSYIKGLVGKDDATTTALGNIGVKVHDFGVEAAASFKIGIDAANAFIGVLLGAEKIDPVGHGKYRSGGLVGALASVGEAIVTLTGMLVGAVATIIGLIQRLGGWLTAPLPGSGHDEQKGVSPWDVGSTIIKGVINQMLYGNPTGPRGKAEGGWVGLNGPEVVMTGEKGPEYIVPNGGAMPGGAGGPTINMHFDFLSMPSDAQLRSLTDQVSRRLAFELAQSPVTSKPYGSF